MFNGRRYAYPKSPDLQKLRVNIDYSISGVSIDFMGPLYCKNIYVNHLEDDEMHKCCIFRRYYVTDVHADTLLLSLTQYISRKVCPSKF